MEPTGRAIIMNKGFKTFKEELERSSRRVVLNSFLSDEHKWICSDVPDLEIRLPTEGVVTTHNSSLGEDEIRAPILRWRLGETCVDLLLFWRGGTGSDTPEVLASSLNYHMSSLGSSFGFLNSQDPVRYKSLEAVAYLVPSEYITRSRAPKKNRSQWSVLIHSKPECSVLVTDK